MAYNFFEKPYILLFIKAASTF